MGTRPPDHVACATPNTQRLTRPGLPSSGPIGTPKTSQREILPRLKRISLRRKMEATGLSLRYCGLVQWSEDILHLRHSEALAELRVPDW